MDLLTSETSYGHGDHSWLGSAHGTEDTVTITLDLAAFTKATQFPDGYIPSGAPIGTMAGNPDTYGPYDNVDPASLAGYLFADVPVANDDGTIGVGYALGALFTHGSVIIANLPTGFATIDATAQADVPNIRHA